MTTHKLYVLMCTFIAVQGAGILADVAIAPQTACADTFYVAKNGSNDNSCTEARSRSMAKLTINEGLKCLTAGDTLYIGTGTYEEAINENSLIPSGTSWDNAVTIAAVPGESVVLKPNGTYEVISLVGSSIRYLVFDRLILDAANVFADGFSMTNGANHIRLQNSEVKHAPVQGILITKGSGNTEYNEFCNLTIHDNGHNRLSHGMYISTSNNLIEHNNVYHNSGYGIHVYDDVGDVNNNVVRLNIAWENSTTDCCDAGILVGSGNGNIAYNNIVYGNPYGIISGFSQATNTKIYNNTVYNNSEYGIQNRSTSTNAIIMNNIVYLSSTAIQDLGTDTTLSHNLTGDPKFVDASTFDFRLKPESPAIDSGKVLNEVSVDFRGVSRPKGTAPDIGAYEFENNSFSSTLAPPSELRVSP